MKPVVYIGADAREEVALNVCSYSLLKNTKTEVDIFELRHRDLRKKGLFWRPWHTHPTEGHLFDGIDLKPFSTEFSHTRFLVPALQNYEGWALFMDCDMLWRSDIKELWDMLDDKYAAMVVKHNHIPKETVKMDDQIQTTYKKKNWSSFVAFNCSHPANKVLTPEIVNSQTGTWLHQFSWLHENQIGHLGFDYNWIENISTSVSQKVIHYTLGGPWFSDYRDVMFGDLWVEEYERWQRDGGESYSHVPTTRHDFLK